MSVLVVAVVGLLYLGVALWMLRARSEFLRLYRERRDPDLLLPEEAAERLLDGSAAPRLDVLGSVGDSLRATSEQQGDQVLERARQKYRFRSKVLTASMFLALLICAVALSIRG